MPARRLALSALAVLILLLGGVIGAGLWKGGWQAEPKLALDLEGGTQVILTASSLDGSPVDRASMDQAREIMSQRINAMGVSETEISVQGGSNIVVDVPGRIDQKTSDALRRTAAMSFRPVLGEGAASGDTSDAGGSDGGASDAGGQVTTVVPTQGAQASDGGGATSDGGGATSDGGGANGSSGIPAWSAKNITTAAQQAFAQADCTKNAQQIAEAAAEAKPSDMVVVCDPSGQAKYLLGPQTVAGSGITGSSVSQASTSTGQSTGGYVVNVSFDDQSGKSFGAMTTALYSGKDAATNQFAIVLDGAVVSAPQVQAPTSTQASIQGNFTKDSAQQLSDQLKFGALPLRFTVQSEQQISATLGTDQLQKGILAGLIGLLLVVLYAIAQYRVLALVTTSSLIVMGGLAYGVITIMSNLSEIGYRLSLAGVAGLIVAIGFTADSFIVYFERVRDEIRDGRGIVSAVDHGWHRARRTIVASDTVNVIAAVVLYLLSTGSVRGFAFTLGLTTLLDLVVVFLFTHPLLQVLVRTRFFGKGHPLSGLDPAALGRDLPAYAGRGRVRTSEQRRRRRAADDEDETAPETLAQRKARLAREAAAREEAASADDGGGGEASERLPGSGTGGSSAVADLGDGEEQK